MLVEVRPLGQLPPSLSESTTPYFEVDFLSFSTPLHTFTNSRSSPRTLTSIFPFDLLVDSIYTTPTTSIKFIATPHTQASVYQSQHRHQFNLPPFHQDVTMIHAAYAKPIQGPPNGVVPFHSEQFSIRSSTRKYKRPPDAAYTFSMVGPMVEMIRILMYVQESWRPCMRRSLEENLGQTSTI